MESSDVRPEMKPATIEELTERYEHIFQRLKDEFWARPHIDEIQLEKEKVEKALRQNLEVKRLKLFKELRIDIRKRVCGKIDKEKEEKEGEMMKLFSELSAKKEKEFTEQMENLEFHIENRIRAEKKQEVEKRLERERIEGLNSFQSERNQSIRKLEDLFASEKLKLMENENIRADEIEKIIRIKNEFALREYENLLRKQKEMEVRERLQTEQSDQRHRNQTIRIVSDNKPKKESRKKNTSIFRRFLNFLRCS